VKYIPAWLPGAEFKRFAQEAQVIAQRVRDDPIAIAKADMVSINYYDMTYGL
jgi:hypothetical protein